VKPVASRYTDYDRNHVGLVVGIFTGHSPKRTPFQNGIDSPICVRCLEKDETATHILCDCEAIAYVRFRHMGHCFMEPDNYHNAPVRALPHCIRSVGLLKS
jgi:hypothetical protein